MSAPKFVRLVKLSGVAARKGDRVMCPNPLCRVPIATFRYELLAGAPSIGIDAFDFAESQKRDAGDGATCKACMTPFMVDDVGTDGGRTYSRRRFFTQAGWVAYELPPLQRRIA